jgi:hypothetical protein
MAEKAKETDGEEAPATRFGDCSSLIDRITQTDGVRKVCISRANSHIDDIASSEIP